MSGEVAAENADEKAYQRYSRRPFHAKDQPQHYGKVYDQGVEPPGDIPSPRQQRAGLERQKGGAQGEENDPIPLTPKASREDYDERQPKNHRQGVIEHVQNTDLICPRALILRSRSSAR